MSIRIELLAAHPQAIPQLGQWMHEAWPAAGYSAADRAAVYLPCLNTERVPCALVALDDGELVGTVSLLEHSVASHEHLRPWVAALYVAPAWRHAGLGTRLVAEAGATARRLGVRTVYIGVSFAARAHYERQGWRHVDVGRVDDEPEDCVDVLQRVLVASGG